MLNRYQKDLIDSLDSHKFSLAYSAACTVVIEKLFEEINELKQDVAALRYKGHE